MVRTAAADELCEYCQVSLEFFSNTARWEVTEEIAGTSQLFRYLHYLRHYRDKRQEAGYHLLDRSRLEDRDLTVSNMKELEETVSSYRVKEWCDVSNYPGADTSTFPG